MFEIKIISTSIIFVFFNFFFKFHFSLKWCYQINNLIWFFIQQSFTKYSKTPLKISMLFFHHLKLPLWLKNTLCWMKLKTSYVEFQQHYSFQLKLFRKICLKINKISIVNRKLFTKKFWESLKSRCEFSLISVKLIWSISVI